MERQRTLSGRWLTLIVIALLVIDQAVKIWIKTHMTLDESITVFHDWFFIHFIENPGAAFGAQIGGAHGKLLLSLLRLVAIGLVIWYICRLIRKGAPRGLLVGGALVLAGALGNVLDSAFYGLIFSESTPGTVATLFPDGGGYAGFLHGKVVDMLYFPLFDGTYPSWFPWVGGEPFTFFSPIFNLADSYITIAVIYILLFQRKYFS
jgi:signal peptidase II